MAPIRCLPQKLNKMYPKINKMASIRCLPPKINNIAPKINHCCFSDHDDHDYGDLDWGDHGKPWKK